MGDKDSHIPKDPPKWFSAFQDKLSAIIIIEKTVKENQAQLSSLVTTSNFLSDQFDQFRAELSEIKQENTTLKADNEALKSEITSLKNNVNYLEAQSRRNNLIFDGIEEKEGESWDECERALQSILIKHLGDCITEQIHFERVHRIGQSTNVKNKARQIVAKFTFFKQRNLVLTNSAKFKGTKIWISEDYPQAVKNDRKQLMPFLLAARRSEKVTSCSLKIDKLYINKKQYSVQTMDKIPDFLRPENSSTITTEETVVFASKFSIFSNLHKCDLDIQGETYNSTEQFIQVSKARVFGDQDSELKIKNESDTFLQMQLGKNIKHFKTHVWKQKAKDILLKANFAKFTQHKYAKDALLSTGNRLLGEATLSPLFGIGHSLKSKTVSRKEAWTGQNLMGEVLSEVRGQLQKH